MGKNAQLSTEERTMKCLLYFLKIKQEGASARVVDNGFCVIPSDICSAVLTEGENRSPVMLAWSRTWKTLGCIE